MGTHPEYLPRTLTHGGSVYHFVFEHRPCDARATPPRATVYTNGEAIAEITPHVLEDVDGYQATRWGFAIRTHRTVGGAPTLTAALYLILHITHPIEGL